MKLTATFNIQLSKPFFILGPVENIQFNIELDNFQDVVTLVPASKGQEYKSQEDKWPTYCVNKLVLSVSATEDSPPTKVNEDGTRNYEAIVAYFDERIDKYANHAELLVKRLILFFKYELRNPLLNPDELDISGLYNPLWTDESGQELEPTRRCFTIEKNSRL